MFKRFLTAIVTFAIILGGICIQNVSAELVSQNAQPMYNPPSQEHPRVYFRKTDIPRIMADMESAENETACNLLWEYAKSKVNVGESYSELILKKIEAKAFCYQLYGNAEEGRQAVEAMLAVSAWNDIKDASDNTRRYGACIEMTGIVYDWCYDLTSAEEKARLISTAEAWAECMEIGWPPDKQGSLVGHGAEAQLLKDDLAFAIATYDERPDIWNYIGGKFYEEYVPERQWHNKSQINHQGNNYGPYRNQYSAYAYLLITGMGAPEPYSGYDVGTHAYSHNIYSRRPDGTVFLSGDMWSSQPMAYNNQNTEQLLVETACSKDPLVKDELIRISRISLKNGGFSTNIAVSPSKWILFNQPSVKRASREGMPLSYYFGSPMGVMYARTGWQEGVDSPAAVAEMNVGEYYFGNHQHKDAGSFQLYYKGPLATESGFYQNGVYYGSEDHYNYTMQTTAHNCMLVYDPSEDATDFCNKTNDGGQRWPNGQTHPSYKDLMNDSKYHRASVEAEEIDPQNPMVPLYTYLKGNLTNAYSDKVSDYKRSFMFLNLWDEKTPSALIVFDKLSVSKPEYEKAWLLHGQQKPQIDGSRFIWKSNTYTDKSTGESYTGKMVHDLLLPSSDKASIKIASGEELGWNTVRGNNFEHPEKSADREENTYRMEISPKENTQTTYFLNVLQTTDEDNAEYYDTKLLETTNMYGVKIKDRIVMFSKTGNKLSSKQTINGGGKYTVCDMQAGTYQITSSDGSVQFASVSEKGGVLAFAADGESVTIEKCGSDAARNVEIRKPDGTQSVIIKIDGNLALMGTPAEVVNDKIMISAEDLALKMGISRVKNDKSDTYYDAKQQIKVSLERDSDIITVNGEPVYMINKSYDRNGILMTELRAFAEAFNYVVNWDDVSGGAYLVSDKKIKINGEKLEVEEIKDHESIKANAVVFTEAESAYKMESGKMYDTRKFLSGGAGVTEHNTENTALKYTVNIPTDGNYKLAIKYVAWMDGDTVRNVTIDGKTYSIVLPATPSWGADPDDWRVALTQNALPLSAGEHNIDFTAISNSWNFDWFAFAAE